MGTSTQFVALNNICGVQQRLALRTTCLEWFNSSSGSYNPKLLSGPDVLTPADEALEVNTNEAAQTGLTTIELLELCKDQLPVEAPIRRPRQRRGA